MASDYTVEGMIKKVWPGVMAQSQLLGRWRWEGSRFKASLEQKVRKTPSQQIS
jgi:hypothetical protein